MSNPGYISEHFEILLFGPKFKVTIYNLKLKFLYSGGLDSLGWERPQTIGHTLERKRAGESRGVPDILLTLKNSKIYN